MKDTHRYDSLKPVRASYFVVLTACVLAIAIGAYCAFQLEHMGHVISGMNNHVVWGLPHVFAITLIVGASGALNGASLSSVFGLTHYKPVAQLSVVLAMCLLVGGLLVLVLDLGRPDRLIIAMTTYNFRSVFSWNIFLYTGFLVICVAYLSVMMEQRYNRYISTVGKLALAWRIVLTTGTGSIFGFLVGRNSLDSALLAPLFVALSLVIGTSVLALVLLMINRWQGSELSATILISLRRILVWCLLALAYFSLVQHVTNLYVTEHHETERYILLGGLSHLFWLGHLLIGVVLPLCLLTVNSVSLAPVLNLAISAVLSIFGSMALLYVVIIGSQSTPQVLFPGKTVLSSRFGDAGFPSYVPSAWEWGLGVGGVAASVLLCLLTLRVLPLVPEPSLSSDNGIP